MFAETNYAIAAEMTHLFPALLMRAGLPANDADLHDLAIQALRDVRHLLPAEGVEIVDAVLDQIS